MRTRSQLENPAARQLALDLKPSQPVPVLMDQADAVVAILARLLLEAANLLPAGGDHDAA
jgi:hypothetical protein